ncbi:hypothetical protein G1H11_10305 [Phytoactinopolyspora alkaliphila]|uniref:VTT domain-containing protein n=1 Tax=Phytoactinopolyspora alkaliphila TaxID=1783498 RepID=A0A6N9YL37_9ACTN|nr:hypothetical protein [Phytoactinopolyspora alkaliphila]
MELTALVAIPVLAYLVIALLVAFDAMIPAVPSEVALVTAGTLAAGGAFNAGWAVAAAVAGALAGDYAVYSLGRHRLPGALDRSRLGRRIQRGAEHAYSRMGSASAMAIVAGRFVPLGRTASSAAAGLAGVSRRVFLVFSGIGGIVWAAWMVGVGYATGTVTDAPMWLQSVIGVAIAVLAGVWIAAVHAVLRTRRRMAARARSRPGLSGQHAAPTTLSAAPAPSRSALGTFRGAHPAGEQRHTRGTVHRDEAERPVVGDPQPTLAVNRHGDHAHTDSGHGRRFEARRAEDGHGGLPGLIDTHWHGADTREVASGPPADRLETEQLGVCVQVMVRPDGETRRRDRETPALGTDPLDAGRLAVAVEDLRTVDDRAVPGQD